MLRSIEESVQHYWAAVERQSDKPRKDQIRRLELIDKTARRLALLLRPEDAWEWSKSLDFDLIPELKNLTDQCGSKLYDLQFEERGRTARY